MVLYQSRNWLYSSKGRRVRKVLVETTTKTIHELEAAAALFLDHSEELSTITKYEGHLVHFAHYLASHPPV